MIRFVQEALLLYHFVLSLSRTFLIYFVDPFFIRTAATFTSYHVLSCLSRTFLILFWNIFFKSLWNNMFLTVSHRQLKYNIISDLICQELFNFSFRSDLYCSDRSPSATFIDYHIWSLVSRSFFILFRSQISSDVIFSCRSFSDVDYLTIAVYSMSTAFCLFFIFIKTNFIP